MQHQVVDAGRGDRGRVRAEIGNAGARHLERAHLTLDRAHGAGRIDLQRRGHEVAIEEIVEVLVGCDARHHLVAGFVLEQVPGVAMRDARRQLLQRYVRERVDRGCGLRHLAATHLVHPRVLERHQIDRVRDRDVVADHDPVAHLLRGPAARPLAPGFVREHPVDGLEIVRKVVLGEEIDDERAAHT